MGKSISGSRVRNAEASFIVRGERQGDVHNIAPWCVTPISIAVTTDRKKGMPAFSMMAETVRQGTGEVVGGRMVPHYPELALQVACRRCEGCLAHKKRLWVSRAYQETVSSFRTWFGTLTFTPTAHQRALVETMSRAWAAGIDYSALPQSEQFALEAAVLYEHVDLFWKRLRKAKHRFRYLCVPEPHESGLVHFHVLIHEITPHQLPKATLEAQWQQGLCHWRLVDTGDKRAVYYVCKYLGKEGLRPRNSLHYGKALTLTSMDKRRAALAKAKRVELSSPTIETREEVVKIGKESVLNTGEK